MKRIIPVFFVIALTACGPDQPDARAVQAALQASQEEARDAAAEAEPDPLMLSDKSVMDYYNDRELTERTRKACAKFARATHDMFVNTKFPACDRSSAANTHHVYGSKPE